VVRNRMPGGVRGSGGDPAAYSILQENTRSVSNNFWFCILCWRAGHILYL